jgi:hypothetical protein
MKLIKKFITFETLFFLPFQLSQYKRPQLLYILTPIVPFRRLYPNFLKIFLEFILVSLKEVLHSLPIHLKDRLHYPRIDREDLQVILPIPLGEIAYFPPNAVQAHPSSPVRCHDDDPRNLEGRRGIERRNRLHQTETQLRIAEAALEEAIALLSEPSG